MTATRETVGRTYKTTRYGVHSRQVGTEGWYGTSNYKTLDEAQEAIKSLGGRYMNLGGLVIDTGAATDIYEYRIVKCESVNEVIEVFVKKI